MSGKYLLDTSIIVELFANDRAVHKRLEKAESVFIPSIAVGESQKSFQKWQESRPHPERDSG
jgi:tRNA(fMet)-specific endonuclease VapC